MLPAPLETGMNLGVAVDAFSSGYVAWKSASGLRVFTSKCSRILSSEIDRPGVESLLMPDDHDKVSSV
jgi:hypothetical protein